MINNLTTRFPAPVTASLTEFDAVFAGLGIVLPQDFHDFYFIHQGMTPVECITGDEKLWCFLPVKVPAGWEIPTVADDAIMVRDMLDGISFEWLPFAVDPGGNYTCIKLNEPNAGSVYFLDHHFLGLDDALSFICSTFEEYINGLVPQVIT